MAITNPTPASGESAASGAAKKIGSSSIWVPGPALSLLLLLLLPPPVLSTGSFLHRLPAWRNSHQGTRHYRSKTEKVKTCEGAFDLYFILDMSDSVNNNWKDIYTFVDEVVKKFPNLKMQMSFITYSTQGHTVMELTSDRNEISDGLTLLQNIVPNGATNMHEGFKKANEQIEQANSGGHNAASLIIALTTGPLTQKAFEETKSEAEKARNMGAKVYCVGVKDYRRDQLNDIVERRDQMYAVDNGFKSLEDIINLLVVNSCHEVMAGESYFLCLGEDYAVTFYDTSLDLYTKDEIVCRYKLEDNSVYDKKPIYKNNESLVCPGHIFEKPGKVVIIEYSLNNGVTFIEENIKATSLNCGDPLRPKEPPEKTTMPTTTTQTMITPMTTARKTTMPTTTTWTTTMSTTTTWMTTMPTTTTPMTTTSKTTTPMTTTSTTTTTMTTTSTTTTTTTTTSTTTTPMTTTSTPTTPMTTTSMTTTPMTTMPMTTRWMTTMPTMTTQTTTMPMTTTWTTTTSTTTTRMTTTSTTTTQMTPTPTTTTQMSTTPRTTTQTTTMSTMITQTTTKSMTTTQMTTTPTMTMQMTTVSTVDTWEMNETAVFVPRATVAMFVTEKPIIDKSVLYPVLIPTLLIIPVVIYCIYCCKNRKEPPAVSIIQRGSETCTPMIVPCPYQEDMRRIEGKLNFLCDFVESHSQLPVMCQPSDQERYIGFTLMKPLCTQFSCDPKISFHPARSAFPSIAAAHGANTPLPYAPSHPPGCCR